MFFFQDGTVQDLIECTLSQGGYIPELNILHMFKSLCDAILAFHSLEPPLAHRDIKVGRVCSYVIECWRQFSWETACVSRSGGVGDGNRGDLLPSTF